MRARASVTSARFLISLRSARRPGKIRAWTESHFRRRNHGIDVCGLPPDAFISPRDFGLDISTPAPFCLDETAQITRAASVRVRVPGYRLRLRAGRHVVGCAVLTSLTFQRLLDRTSKYYIVVF